eukprot:TRINITY_DN4111_c0_g1_i1.p2 TRINITY_DN4111_c0_g1~~TRINITY_DN4111_c0_g1_i1.p2  ORF type:complete len:385 (-),score=102.96 TRINITY_DN4111_c0_g1_i1:74-1228(-)
MAEETKSEAGPTANTERYTPQVILLTGGCGFIGSHVLRHLVKAYPACRVVNLDLVDYCATLKNTADIADRPNYRFVQGSILDETLVNRLFQELQVDTVMHFAALSHVDLSFTSSSVEFTKTNVVGTHVLLEAARRYRVRRFIHVSTDEVYGETLDGKVDEMTLLNPTNPYSCSKAAAESIVRSYITLHRLPVIITRGNNVYGPGQYPEKVIPKFICRLLRDEPCCLHGNGNTLRNYISVDDVVSAFDVILHHGRDFEAYNIGTDHEVSVLHLAQQLVRLVKGEGAPMEKWLEYVPDRRYNDLKYLLDFSKLTALGWRSEVSFEEGLRRTVEWYKEHHLAHWDKGLDHALSPQTWEDYEKVFGPGAGAFWQSPTVPSEPPKEKKK